MLFLVGFILSLIGFKGIIKKIIIILSFLAVIFLVLAITSEPIRYDASIQASLSSLRTQAELFWDKNKSYGNQSDFCDSTGSIFEDMQVTNLIKAAEKLSRHKAVCFSNPEAWAVSIELRNQRGFYYCVDSTGPGSRINANITGPSCASVKVGDLLSTPSVDI